MVTFAAILTRPLRLSTTFPSTAPDGACTTAYETRHIAQDEGTRLDYGTAEDGANTYAEDAMQRLWPAVKEDLPERAAPESIPSTTYQTR
jgi:hypothetical protein